jgi:hypothetical protein
MTSPGLSAYSQTVEVEKHMALALERRLTPATRLPQRPDAVETESTLNIAVVFTSVEATLPALKEAGSLAAALGAHITLMVPQVVPYALPISSPPVLLDWNARRLRVIAEQSKVDTTVQLYLCRHREQALLKALAPHSLVVIGGRKRWWWPTSEERLGRSLRHAGHEVIFCGNGVNSHA